MIAAPIRTVSRGQCGGGGLGICEFSVFPVPVNPDGNAPPVVQTEASHHLEPVVVLLLKVTPVNWPW